MDIRLFVRYERTAEVLITKLFRVITLHTIPLQKGIDLREAHTDDVTPLNKINGFDVHFSSSQLALPHLHPASHKKITANFYAPSIRIT